MSERIRLDRFLAEEGIGSRADVKKVIRSGRVCVNGCPARSGDQKIDPDADEVLADGKIVRRMAAVTVMLNKPAGFVSATKDGKFRTVTDLIREPWAGGLFPVGRLDKDTEGLLLLTGDGALCHDLLSPKKHVRKTYFAVISGAPDPELVAQFRDGIEIGEKRKTLPAKLVFVPKDLSASSFVRGEVEDHCAFSFARSQVEDQCDSGFVGSQVEGQIVSGFAGSHAEEQFDSGFDGSRADEQYVPGFQGIQPEDLARCGENECCVIITIMEGKFHQIKRMFGAFGREVHFLKRIAMGGLMLDPALKPGEYRILTDEEMKLLKN